MTPSTAIAEIPAPTAPPAGVAKPRLSGDHFPVLDGWRGLSILAVLAAHMLPLGPRRWDLNVSAGLVGMSLFFTLSGFLITLTLLRHPSVPSFLIRRGCRILPLAMLYMTLVLLALRASPHVLLSHLTFIANYDSSVLTHYTSHMWSLCVETQFYVLIALIFAAGGRRGLLLAPLAAIAVTLWRVHDGSVVNIKTHLRIDEIFAGSCLALIYFNPRAGGLRSALARMNQPLAIALLLVSTLSIAGPMGYLRPYFGALAIGATLFGGETLLSRKLSTRPLRYMATVSYAVYVIHPITMFGWLGSGSSVIKYLKRPICFALTFAAAHLSTYHYEEWWIRKGKKWSARFVTHRTAATAGEKETPRSPHPAVENPRGADPRIVVDC